jgi:hypothetical protein
MEREHLAATLTSFVGLIKDMLEAFETLCRP